MNWGGKTDHEIGAGNTPFYMGLALSDDHRIAQRTERLDGRRETWRFTYDDAGRLTDCKRHWLVSGV